MSERAEPRRSLEKVERRLNLFMKPRSAAAALELPLDCEPVVEVSCFARPKSRSLTWHLRWSHAA